MAKCNSLMCPEEQKCYVESMRRKVVRKKCCVLTSWYSETKNPAVIIGRFFYDIPLNTYFSFAWSFPLIL